MQLIRKPDGKGDRQTNRQVCIKQVVVRQARMQTVRRNSHVGQAGRQADKQTDGKTYRQARRQAGMQTDRQKNGKQAGKQVGRHTANR